MAEEPATVKSHCNHLRKRHYHAELAHPNSLRNGGLPAGNLWAECEMRDGKGGFVFKIRGNLPVHFIHRYLWIQTELRFFIFAIVSAQHIGSSSGFHQRLMNINVCIISPLNNYTYRFKHLPGLNQPGWVGGKMHPGISNSKRKTPSYKTGDTQWR